MRSRVRRSSVRSTLAPFPLEIPLLSVSGYILSSDTPQSTCRYNNCGGIASIFTWDVAQRLNAPLSFLGSGLRIKKDPHFFGPKR